MKSTFTFMKGFVNSHEIGAEVSRYQMQSAFRREFLQDRAIDSVDSYKSYFVKLGYLEMTKVKGFFKVANHLPVDLKASELRRAYNEATGFTEKKIAHFKAEVSNADYLAIKYKPVEFIIMNGLSFVQGVILQSLVEAASSELNCADGYDKTPIDKIIYYANIADFMNHVHKGTNHASAIVTRFCEINDLNLVLSTILKRALQNNWALVLEECKNLKTV